MTVKIKKTKQVHLGRRVSKDERGQMFVESGNARVYLNRATATKIEARQRKK